MPAQERWIAHFSGHVQGVGFRFTVVDLAEQFPTITGEVRNLRDGRVELIAEGPSGQLDRFLAAIKRRMDAYIREVETRREPATGEFNGFDIAR